MTILYIVCLLALTTLVWWGVRNPTRLHKHRYKFLTAVFVIALSLDYFKPGAFVPFWIIGFIPFFIAVFIKRP